MREQIPSLLQSCAPTSFDPDGATADAFPASLVRERSERCGLPSYFNLHSCPTMGLQTLGCARGQISSSSTRHAKRNGGSLGQGAAGDAWLADEKSSKLVWWQVKQLSSRRGTACHFQISLPLTLRSFLHSNVRHFPSSNCLCFFGAGLWKTLRLTTLILPLTFRILLRILRGMVVYSSLDTVHEQITQSHCNGRMKSSPVRGLDRQCSCRPSHPTGPSFPERKPDVLAFLCTQIVCVYGVSTHFALALSSVTTKPDALVFTFHVELSK